jgi:two-component sensor histidine kinase
MATCNRLQDVELRLEPTPEAAYEARMAVRERFYDSLPAVTLHDLMIVVTELVTNSVKYGPGGEIEVRIGALPEGVVRGEVRDPGGSGAQPAIRESPSLEGGLGLRMVDALTRRWGVDAGERTRVWFELGFAEA